MQGKTTHDGEKRLGMKGTVRRSGKGERGERTQRWDGEGREWVKGWVGKWTVRGVKGGGEL